MSGAINLLIGWNSNEEFFCVVCGLPVGEPISHLKLHVTHTDFCCIDCDVKCGESTEGYDSFVNHVEQARHLNYQFTCMKCNHSEFYFIRYMKHLQIHNYAAESGRSEKMSGAINLLIGWNSNEEFFCVVCGLSVGEPISHLKLHVTHTDFCCIDCDVKCGESTEGYDSFVNHVEQARHLNYQFTCMKCNHSEFYFIRYMKHLQIHNYEEKAIKTEEDDDIEISVESVFEEVAESELQALALMHIISRTSAGESKCVLCENLMVLSPDQVSSHVDWHMRNTTVKRAKISKKFKFTCKLCNLAMLGKYRQYLRHMYYHENDLLLCRICKEMNNSEAHLFQHILRHYPETLFYCRICFRTFNDFSACKQHYLRHKVPLGEELSFGIYSQCPVCGELETADPTWKIIHHLSGLDSHGCNWENGTFVSYPRKGAFVCRNVTAKLSGHEHSTFGFDKITCSCDFECDDASTLNSHFLQHTLYYKPPSLNTQPSPSTCTLQVNDAKQSELCQYSWPKTDDQKSSLKSLKPTEQQTSWSDVNLLRYTTDAVTLLQTYHDSVIEKSCIICSGKSKTAGDFFKHVSVHFPDNMFYCRLCFKTFGKFLSAVQHSRQCLASHTGRNHYVASIVGFICSICGHNDFSNRRQFIIAHLFQHYDQAMVPGFSSPQKTLLCKGISANLMCYQHFLGEFDSATFSCEEQFDNIRSLCDHVQQHIVKFKSKTERKDSERGTVSTDFTTSEEVPSVKREVVEPTCYLPSGKSVAIKFGEANTSDITSQLSVEQCDVAEVDIKDERDNLGQNTTVALNAIKEEKMETLESNDKESRQRAELIDFNSATSARTSQKVSQVLLGDISVPYSIRLGKTFPAYTVDPSGCTGNHKPDEAKLSANFVMAVSGNSKRTFNAAFISETHHTALKQQNLAALKEQERTPLPVKSKIKIFVCKVCDKRFISEHFLKKHLAQH